MKFASPSLKFSISGLRGVYPADIAPDKWVEYVRAYAAVLPSGAVAIARDARATGPGLMRLAAGVLTLLGRDVHDLGLVPTPTIKAYVNSKKLAGGLMVSASHNPAEYNALKFIKTGGWFFDATDNNRFSQALEAKSDWGSFKKQGKIIEAHRAAIELHIKSILRVTKRPKRKLKVVIDPVGSCGGEIALDLLRALGVSATAIHLKETASFPRPPEPTADALRLLRAAVKKYKADVGFAFDPDADRLSLVDENGIAIGEEYTLPLAILAAAKPNGTVVANLSTSMLTEVAAQLKNNTFVRSTVGEANVVAQMLRDKSALGGEGNGGVIDARIPSYGRDALAGVAHIITLLASDKKKLSEWVKTLPRFSMTKQVRQGASAADLEKAAQKLTTMYPGAILDVRDGFHVSQGGDEAFWVHLRASNTEPVIRIIAEAQNEAQLKKILKVTAL